MSKNNQLISSPNKIHTPKNTNSLQLNPSKYFSYQNKIEHLIINSNRNSSEHKEEKNNNSKQKNFNATFF